MSKTGTWNSPAAGGGRGDAGPSIGPAKQSARTDPRLRRVDNIGTIFLFDLIVDLHPPLDFGSAQGGRRILYGAAGGNFSGDRLRGEVVPGGGDWASFHPGGKMFLDVRLTLRTHDDAFIHMTYGGRWVTPPELRAEMGSPTSRSKIDPARYYFRTTPYFETGSPAYSWLNDLVCVGSGYLVDGGVGYRVFEVS